jgi:CheY-like chemotaxis protein
MNIETIGIEVSKYLGGILIAIFAKLAYDGSRWGKKESKEPNRSICEKHEAFVVKLDGCIDNIVEIKPLVSKIFDILREISERMSGIENIIYFNKGKETTQGAKELTPLLCLVVDDNQDVLDSTCWVIENASEGDMKCIGSKTVGDAKKHLSQTTFDLILIDYYIGDDSGYEFYKLINKEYPEIKCIIYSAKSPTTIESDIADIYIEKPFSAIQLLKKIDDVL